MSLLTALLNKAILKTSMRPVLTIVTPDMASEWLNYNTLNRKTRDHHVSLLAKEIIDGNYMLTHQAIAFEGDELSPKRLLDGQHTLSAIKKSGVSIIKWVFWECPSETFAYIDSGKTRTFLDRHRDKGWNKHTISFAIGVYRVLSSSRTDSPSESQMDEIMEIFGDEFNALLESCTTTKRGLTPIPVKIGFVYSMMSYPEHRQMFLDSWRLLVLGDLASLPLSFVKLFVKLTEIRGAGSDAARLQLATTVKCLNPKNWRLSKVHVNVDELYKETSDGLKRIMLKSD